jgi:beta-N-acetylhexosaminidase
MKTWKYSNSKGGPALKFSMSGNRPIAGILSVVLVYSICFRLGLLQANVHQNGADSLALHKADDEWVDKTLRGLSLEEKIGQMLQIRYYNDYTTLDSPEYRTLRDDVRKYHIGSLVLYLHVAPSGLVRVSPLAAAKVSNQLQHDSDLPLLLAADIERGVATRLTNVPSFPWPMAFGAAADLNLIKDFGVVTGVEARAVGIHWALAPVADVNLNAANPTINDRSFGEDVEQVSARVSAFIKGAHSAGLLVTAKHFPGTGDVSVDPHRAIASIDADLDHLRQFEFPPFTAAITSGVDSIMLAHSRVPALEPDPDKIATISSRVVTDTLKGQLGFRGVVLTDALEMRGLTQIYDSQKGNPSTRAAVDAIKAGCDVIMMPTDLDASFHAIIDAVHSGEISESRIDESVRKILEMKASVGLDKKRFVDLNQVVALTSKPQDVALAQHVADEAVTLIRDSGKVLPLRALTVSSSNLKTESANPQLHGGLSVILLAEGLEDASGREFEREIRARRPDAAIFRFDGRFSTSMIPELLKTAGDASQVVLATYIIHEATREFIVNGKKISYFGIRGRGGRLFQEIVTKYPEKTAVIALGSPYLIESFPNLQTYICTYAMASTSEISAVKAMFGEIQNHAKLPVTLPGIAPRGFSLPWPTQP